jgi:hypothetical protein
MAVDYKGFSSAPQLVWKGSVTPGSITNVTATKVSVTVPGSVPGMFFIVAAPDLENNLAIADAYCSAAGTVVVRVVNPTAAPIVGAAQIWYVIGL